MTNNHPKISLLASLLLMMSSFNVYSSDDNLNPFEKLKDKNVVVSIFRQTAGLLDPRDTEGTSIFICSATESQTTFGVKESAPDTWETFPTESVMHVFGLKPTASGSSLYVGNVANDSQWFLIGNDNNGTGWLDIWSEQYDSVTPKNPFKNIKSSVSEFLISILVEKTISEKIEAVIFDTHQEQFRINRASNEFTYQQNKNGFVSVENSTAPVFMVKRAKGVCVVK